MIFLLSVIVVQLALLLVVLVKMTENFVNWAKRDLRRKR